eukprot:scaffold11157_cov69-Phaeocystis_antarctica.AAC.3
MVAAPAGLQPYVIRAATLRTPFCSPMHPLLQPYVHVGGASAVPPRRRPARCGACALRAVDRP